MVEHRAVWPLLNALRTEPVTDLAAGRAGKFRRRFHRSLASIGMADHLIAASADVRGFRLATMNARHFPKLDDVIQPV